MQELIWTGSLNDPYAIRGHVGLLDNLSLHKRMIARRRFGNVGLLDHDVSLPVRSTVRTWFATLIT